MKTRFRLSLRRQAWRRSLQARPSAASHPALFAYLLVPVLLVVGFGASLALAPTARADGGAPNLAYVSGTRDGVAIIDLASQRVTGTVQVAGDPRGMTLSADFRFLYVALAAKNGVAVIDAQARQVINTLPTGSGPTALMLDLTDPSHLWVANTGSSTVTVLNPDSDQRLATIPVGLHPASIAIANPTSGISEIDGSSEVLVANRDAGSVSVIGSESYKVLTTVALPAGENPIWVMAPGTGGTAYIATEQGQVYGLTLASHQVFGPIFRAGQLHGMDYNAVTGEIYVPDSQANILNVLHPVGSGETAPATWPSEPARTLSIGGAPWTVAITNDGSLGLVGQHATGDVTLLDVPGRKTIGTVHVGGQPQFVLAGSYPPLVSRQNAQVILIVVYIVAGVLLAGGIGWLIWWMRRQERRIRALHAQEDAEFEQQLLVGQVSQEDDE